MDYNRITIDIETLLTEERPKIEAYLEQKMDLVPSAGVTRELFRLVAQELSEMMFAAGAGRVVNEMRQSVSVVDIDAPREKEVMS